VQSGRIPQNGGKRQLTNRTGVPAKTFVGYNDQIVTTSEIWLIYGGFLYEVTTYQSSATGLRDILRTWRFI
jgi:hypothetical protein